MTGLYKRPSPGYERSAWDKARGNIVQNLYIIGRVRKIRRIRRVGSLNSIERPPCNSTISIILLQEWDPRDGQS
jgi:hypothetical protein